MKRILALVAILVLAGFAATAYAATREQANLVPPGAPAGYLKIDPNTCKFLHPEIDVAPSPSERYARTEDSRDDVKLSCLTRKLDRKGVTAPDQDGIVGYVRVSVAINFKQASASASCPAGDVVLGGGANVEVGGSYPSSNSAWTVTRDHTWGTEKSGSVFAVCAKA